MKKQKRITILTKAEIHELYSLPVSTQDEREVNFALNDTIKEALKPMKNKDELKVYFILLVSYFRLKPVIPIFQLDQEEVQSDAKTVL